MTADNLHLNGTAAMELHDEDDADKAFEFRVFNIVLIALALCILTVTGLYCISICYSRTRQSKRAHVYESAVTRGEPVDPAAVINPLTFFRKQEAAKDNSRIYYIYSNPLPVGLKEEEEERRTKAAQGPEEQAAPSPSPSFPQYATDPNSGFTLDPPIFYMQL